MQKWSRATLHVLLAFAAACSRPNAEPLKKEAVLDASAARSVSATIYRRAPPITAKPRAPIVVTIVVDQLAAWVLAERMPELRADGGFARLAREGTYVKNARFAHAVTDTAPGHAALYTGAPPHESGIFANEVLDIHGKKISILRDQINLQGTLTGDVSSSISALRVPTLADMLREAHPDALIISVSLKDRGAIFGGGRKPTDVIWYDANKGEFVTSTELASKPPAWLAISQVEDLSPLLEKTWDAPLREEWVRTHAATPDDQEGEGDWLGLGRVFPHALAKTSAPAKAFRATPFADRALLSAATRALDDHHAGATPTLLAISLSAFDYVGHVFGPDSWEAWDELDRLDGELAAFFQALDARFGDNGWACLLSADHGVAPMPETAKIPAARPWCNAEAGADSYARPCVAGTRLMSDALGESLQNTAKKTLGPGEWVLGVAEPYVVFTPAAHALPKEKISLLTRAITSDLLGRPGIERVIDVTTFPASCPPESDESEGALLCRSHAEDTPGDLYVVPKSGSFFDPSYAFGAGTSHGTQNAFDRTVPILVRAKGRAEAGKVIDAPASIRSFARTAAALLDVPPPRAASSAPSLLDPGPRAP